MQRSSYRKGLKLYRRKKVYPKQYSRFKSYMRTPIPRSLVQSDTTSVKCEAFPTILYPNTGTQPEFPGSVTYVNVSLLIAGSTTFADMITRYGRYKITGLSLRFDPILDSVSAGNLDNNYPAICIAFYPQLVTTSLGTAILANDQKAYFGSSITVPQTHYWRFPDNYFTASAGGYGTWNNSSTYSTIQGQLSVASPTGNITANAVTYVANLKVVFYVTFSSKNQ